MYGTVLKENHNTMGLIDMIDKEEVKNEHPHYYTRIRRSNGRIGLYETEGLADWFKHQKTDPLTREDIS